MSVFPSVLVSLRRRDGLTQEELSNRIGISKSTVSMYECGKREPDFETIEKIADFFNVDINYLYSGVNSPCLFPVSEWDRLKVALLKDYDLLNFAGQKKLADFAHDLVSSGNYKKTERYVPYVAYGQGNETDHEMDVAQQMLNRAEELAELAKKSDTVTLPEELRPDYKPKNK